MKHEILFLMHYNYCNTSIPQPHIKPLEIKRKQKKNIKIKFIS